MALVFVAAQSHAKSQSSLSPPEVRVCQRRGSSCRRVASLPSPNVPYAHPKRPTPQGHTPKQRPQYLAS